MNSQPSTSSEGLEEYKRISALSQPELTLMGDLEDVDVSPDLFEKAKKACIERIEAILEFSKGGPLGGDESSGIHVLDQNQLRKIEEWQNDNFSKEASEGPDESAESSSSPEKPKIQVPSIVESSEAPGPSEASEDNIRSFDSAGSSEGRSETETEPEGVPGSQGSEDLEFENQGSVLPIPAKRRPGRPRKEKNQKGNIQKEEKVDQKMDHGSSRRKKKQKTEPDKLREMDFGPKAEGSFQDIEDRSSREKQWTKNVLLEQGKQLEESMDHPKLSMSNRVARKSKDLEPVVLSSASNSLVKDLPEGGSDQLVDLDEPESMDLDLDAPNSTFEASMASDSPVEEPLVNLDAPNTTSMASSSPVMDLPEDSDSLVELDKSQTIPEVPSFTNRRSTVPEDPEPLVKPAMPKDDPSDSPIRVATSKTKRNALLDIPNPSKRAKVQVSSIVESSGAPGVPEASEVKIGNLDSAEKAHPESSDDRSDLQETQTELEAVPGYQGSETVSVEGSEDLESENQGSVHSIPAKRRPGRPRKQQNLNLEDKEPEVREPEIPSTPVTNGTHNSRKSLTKPAEASEAPAEPTPAKPAPAKPTYGPSTKIKEIPEWIRKYQVHEEDLPRHGRPWLFSVDHYRPGGPKAPDPRLKLREQDIEKIRKKCGYDKLPVKEKILEKEIEDQAGTSGSSDKLVEQGNSQKKMDQGSEDQRSEDQGSEDQESEISAKRRPGRPRKEQNQNSEDLEPLDLEIPTNGTQNSQKFQAKPAEASEAPAEPTAAEPSPKPAEKRVEKNIEDQAGTSGCSQRKKKLKTEADKLREMDFGPKAGGSLQDIEDRSSREKQWTKQVLLEQGKQLEESMDHPKLSISNRAARKSRDLKPSVSFTASDDPKFKESNDLEPAVSSGASNSPAKDLPEGSEVSDQLVNLDGPESMDLDLDAPNSSSEAPKASNSPVDEPLVNLDPPNSTSMASSSPVQDLPDDSDSLVELDKSQTISEVPNSTSTVQEDPEPLVKPAMTKDNPPELPIRVATLKTKRIVLLDIPNPSKRAKVQVSSIVESSDAPGPSEGLEVNIGRFDSGEEVAPESSEGTSDPQETQTEPEAVPGSQGSNAIFPGPENQGSEDLEPKNQESVLPIPAKRRLGRSRKEQNLNLADKDPEARGPDFIEPEDLESLPTWNGMDNSFPDFDEPGPVPSIVKPSVVKHRNTAGSKGSKSTVPCSSEVSEGRSEVQAGPKPVQGSKTMLVNPRSKDQGSVTPVPAKRRQGRPRKVQNLNSVEKLPEPEFRVPVDMPATRITKLTSPKPREVPKTRVTRITRLLSLPPRIDTPDQLDLDQASSSNGPQRLVPSTSQQGPSRGVPSKPQTKWRRNAIIRTVKTSSRKKASEAVENSESDNDDVEEEKPVCQWNNCGTIFSKNKKFYKHIKNHVHNSTDKITRRNVDGSSTELYKCQWAGCTRTEPFHSYKKMVHHMREHTNEKPNRGGRPLGSFTAGKNQKKTSEAVENSESEDDDVAEEKPECEWNSCGKVFTKNERFYEHVEKHVRKDELRNPTGFYKCRWAGCYRTEPFDKYYKLRYHMRRHTGEKPFKCETCGSRFVRQEGLKNHMRTHTGEKPYKCKVCETTFTTSSDRHSHSKGVHGNVKKYVCKVCENAYTDPSSLRKHVFKKHPEKEDEFRQGKFRRRNNKDS
ncbi:hypothetical protein B9Z55_003455 [Caenorhabditis nigoni]|uniref:C2H2-type domain-containing protein n=1 Tax=Caenorhabditis nigoni TaxID=1611254 RepID=A0A2G5VQJ4_9PELO|nr:hypothetical protein B9Z55_003455 [Caenorhabditis nigoni]